MTLASAEQQEQGHSITGSRRICTRCIGAVKQELVDDIVISKGLACQSSVSPSSARASSYYIPERSDARRPHRCFETSVASSVSSCADARRILICGFSPGSPSDWGPSDLGSGGGLLRASSVISGRWQRRLPGHVHVHSQPRPMNVKMNVNDGLPGDRATPNCKGARS